MLLTSSTRDISDAGIAAEAQAIRDAAGVQSGQTLGPRYTVGHDSTITLTNTDAIAAITNATQAEAVFQDGGTGTANDPFLMENRRYDSSGGITAQPINWTDATATYHLKAKNCHFSGYSIAMVIRVQNVPATASIEFENCSFEYGTNSVAATNGVYGVTGAAVAITLDRCYMPSCGSNGVNITGAYTGTLTITDCKFTDETPWTGTGTKAFVRLPQTAGSVPTVNISYCEFDGSFNDSMSYSLQPLRDCTALTVDNCLFTGGGTTQTIGLGAATTAGPMTVTNCRFSGGQAEYIELNFAQGHEISYCDFLDNAANNRQVYYSDAATNTDDVEVHHCKFTKITGAEAATNECLEAQGSSNIVFHDNWVTTCPEDAYELVQPRAGCKIYNCVGDNVTGQVVDIFEDHASAPGGVQIYNIYGDADIGVDINSRANTGVMDMISGVFVDTTVGTNPIVRLINTSAAPANVTVMSPIWPASKSGNAKSVTVSGVMGANVFFDGVAIT